jgi:nitrite reductase/ring-hydroxylating ferredoxin subunit
MPRLVRVADIQEIPPGHAKVLQVRGREIALFNADGTFYAVKNTCPHRGVSLGQGTVEDSILTCPGHSWQFDLKTGDSVDHPPAGVRCYRVEIQGGWVWVEVP